MKSFGWLIGCALACAHEGKSVVRESDTKIQGTAAEASQPPADSTADAATAAIRPFHVNVPEQALVDLRQRIGATRWPDRETVPDRSQGAQLEKLQALVHYWGTGYDWRKAEAKLNALPQFMTNIDGIDIHFIYVRSRHQNALPAIITHGWPGSVFELIKIIGPLTDPTAFGGRAEDAFDVVIPSLPGYGFSARPTETGWGPDRIGRAWDVLMKRLGYTRYVSQGGDWGAVVAEAMGRQAPAGLLGIHLNLPATVPPDVAAVLAGGGPAPAGLSEKERAVFDSLNTYYKMGSGPRGVDARASRFRAVDVRQRSPKVPDERRGAGRLHAVLADEQRDLVSAAVLGERRTQPCCCGRAEDRRDLAPGGHHGLSGGGLSSPGDMGPARLSQPDLLPRGRQGRTLRRVGAAGAFLRRAALRLQIPSEAAMIATLSSTVMTVLTSQGDCHEGC